jgi:hypothetical protein
VLPTVKVSEVYFDKKMFTKEYGFKIRIGIFPSK